MTTRFNIKPLVVTMLCGCLVGLSSCSDFSEGDSESIIKTDGQVYNSELEARAGLFGLLEGLQQVSDNYVIMGELRADLMTTTGNSSQELHDISELNISADNSYLREREYYALVNDCNYYIQHLDTTVTKLVSGRSQKYLYPYMAQAKAIRAWAYLQLCLDYGSVYYTTQPLLQITKYNNMQASSRRYVAPCRASLVWLRYAECLNRLGKPKMAFNGLLKYGLSAYNINLYRDRPALDGEVTGEPWMDFGQDAPDGELATLTGLSEGAWLSYTVIFPETAYYTFTAEGTGSKVGFAVDGSDIQ